MFSQIYIWWRAICRGTVGIKLFFELFVDAEWCWKWLGLCNSALWHHLATLKVSQSHLGKCRFLLCLVIIKMLNLKSLFTSVLWFVPSFIRVNCATSSSNDVFHPRCPGPNPLQEVWKQLCPNKEVGYFMPISFSLLDGRGWSRKSWREQKQNNV